VKNSFVPGGDCPLSGDPLHDSILILEMNVLYVSPAKPVHLSSIKRKNISFNLSLQPYKENKTGMILDSGVFKHFKHGKAEKGHRFLLE
jgi:hypothetical protein